MKQFACPRCNNITLSLVKEEKKWFWTCGCGFKSKVNYPEVVGTIVGSGRKSIVSIQCPFCGKKHRHSPHPLPGLRRSHCGLPTATGENLKRLLKRYPKAYTGGTYYIVVKEKND